jgi:hypothetical protein
LRKEDLSVIPYFANWEAADSSAGGGRDGGAEELEEEEEAEGLEAGGAEGLAGSEALLPKSPENHFQTSSSTPAPIIPPRNFRRCSAIAEALSGFCFFIITIRLISSALEGRRPEPTAPAMSSPAPSIPISLAEARVELSLARLPPTT